MSMTRMTKLKLFLSLYFSLFVLLCFYRILFFLRLSVFCGPVWLSRYSDTLRAGRPGIEIRRWRDFPHLSGPGLGPTQLPVKWVQGLFPGSKAARAWRWSPTPCSGPSWPVLGWPLPVRVFFLIMWFISVFLFRLSLFLCHTYPYLADHNGREISTHSFVNCVSKLC